MTRSFKLKPSTVHERFGEESVILDLDTGTYFSVQGSGDDIWNLAAAGASEAAILHHMRNEFLGDREAIASAATSFLDRLVDEGLVVGEPADAVAPPAHAMTAAPRRRFEPPVLQRYTDMEELLQIDPIHEVDSLGWPHAKNPE